MPKPRDALLFTNDPISYLAVLGWRLGLGPLLGRRRLLLTTSRETAGAVRRSLVSYRFAAGNLYVPAVEEAWFTDLGARPLAIAQASTGPLAVRARPPRADEAAQLGPVDWVVLEPTAGVVPDIVAPDLTWIWVLGAIGIAVGWRLRRQVDILGQNRLWPWL